MKTCKNYKGWINNLQSVLILSEEPSAIQMSSCLTYEIFMHLPREVACYRIACKYVISPNRPILVCEVSSQSQEQQLPVDSKKCWVYPRYRKLTFCVSVSEQLKYLFGLFGKNRIPLLCKSKRCNYAIAHYALRITHIKSISPELILGASIAFTSCQKNSFYENEEWTVEGTNDLISDRSNTFRHT